MSDAKKVEELRLQKIIEEIFPNSEVKLEGDGWSSIAFSLSRGDEPPQIIRVPRSGDTAQYEREAKLLDFLKGKISVPIPHTKVCKTEKIKYAIHVMICGLKWDCNTYNALSSVAKDAFCDDIASFFTEIHKVDLKKLDAALPLKTLEQGDISRETLEKKFIEYFSKDEITEIYTVVRRVLNEATDPVLLHRDFFYGNTLVDDKHRLIGVFDFGSSCIGSRAYEFISLHWSGYIEILNGVLKKYNEKSGAGITLEQILDQSKLGDVYNVLFLLNNEKLKIEKRDELNDNLNRIRSWLKDGKSK